LANSLYLILRGVGLRTVERRRAANLLLDDLVYSRKTLRNVIGVQQLLVGRLEKAIAAMAS
jgi:hypothetical protein